MMPGREVGDMERQVVGFGEGDEVKLEVKVMGGRGGAKKSRSTC